MTTPPLDPAALERLQQRLADRACICDIECEGYRVRDAAGRLWYDVRPMLNEREHAPEFIDMAREAIDYAIARGLVEPHCNLTHLLRIAVDTQTPARQDGEPA